MKYSKEIIGCIAVLGMLATVAQAEEFQDRVAKLTFGLSADAVLALMERAPDSTQTTTVLGIPKMKWRWSTSNGRSVAVVMIEGRLISTSVCAGIPASEC